MQERIKILEKTYATSLTCLSLGMSMHIEATYMLHAMPMIKAQPA
jgi:hypothetical protein